MEPLIYITLVIAIAALVVAFIALKKKTKVVTVGFKTAKLATDNGAAIETLRSTVTRHDETLKKYELKSKKR